MNATVFGMDVMRVCLCYAVVCVVVCVCEVNDFFFENVGCGDFG